MFTWAGSLKLGQFQKISVVENCNYMSVFVEKREHASRKRNWEIKVSPLFFSEDFLHVLCNDDLGSAEIFFSSEANSQ